MSVIVEDGASPLAPPPTAAAVDAAVWRERIRQETFANYHFEMGRSLRSLGDLVPAIEALKRAVDIKPNHILAQGFLIDLLRRMKKPEELANHSRALSIEPRYETAIAALDLVDQAREHLKNHSIEEAKACLDRAYGLAPIKAACPVVAEALLELAIELGKNDRTMGLPLLEKAAALTPDDPAILDQLGTTYDTLNRWEEAVQCFEAALNITPNNIRLLSHLASALIAMCNFEKAISVTQRQIEVSFGSNAPRGVLSAALIGLNRPAEAIDAIQPMIAANGFDTVALAFLGLAHLTAGNFDAAAAALAKGLSADAGNPVLHGWMGLVRQRQGRFQEALDLHKVAIELTPSLTMSRFDLALTLDAIGHSEDALVEHRHVFAQAGRRVEYWIRTRPWATTSTLAIYRAIGLQAAR